MDLIACIYKLRPDVTWEVTLPSTMRTVYLTGLLAGPNGKRPQPHTMIPEDDFFFRLALTLQMAGAAGNLIDRLYRGYVTDFISVGRFPVFNVADSCITMGVVVLLIGMWIEERRSKDESGFDNSAEPI